MRVAVGLSLQRGINQSLDASRIITGLPAPAWSNLPKRLGAATAEALAAVREGMTIDAASRRWGIPVKELKKLARGE